MEVHKMETLEGYEIGRKLGKVKILQKDVKRTFFRFPYNGKLAVVYEDPAGTKMIIQDTDFWEIVPKQYSTIPTEEQVEEEKISPEEKSATTEVTTEIVPSEKELGTTSQERMTGFLQPVTSIDEAVQLFRLYEDAKTRILTDNDVIWIGKDGRPTEKGQGHPHIKRSGWRKLARFFGLSCKILERKKEWAEDNEGRYYIWTYKVRASHPCGAYQDAEGVCTSRDPFFSKKHGERIEPEEENIMMKAQTVAFNRAISDLLGSGEISAEEVE